ncbi:MAG: glycoside hydrolase family 44 protein [bacterium]
MCNEPCLRGGDARSNRIPFLNRSPAAALAALAGCATLLAAPLRAGALPPGAVLPESGPAVATPVRVDIDAGTVLHTVDERSFHGINFVALWNDTGDAPGAVQAFSRMGQGLVRFPGGCPCEWYDWKDPLASGFSTLTPDAAWRFAKAGGARMIFQTNIANDGGGTNKTTRAPYTFDSSGAHAAGWVNSAREAGIGVAFWEIGNEPEMDAPGPHKKSQEAVYAWYNAKFEEQARAIRKADPKARIMGPAACNTWFWWHEKNLEKFMKAHGNKAGSGLVDAVSLHWYPEGSAGTWAQKRGTAQEWVACMDYIRRTLRQYDTRDLPVYITEWNWGAGDKTDGARRLSNALGVADCLGMFLRTGVAGQTFFCLQKIDRGWGVLAMKQDCRPQNSASPTYYALALASQLGGAVLATTNSADEANVLSAYATRKKNGSLQVMLINKSNGVIPVQLAFRGYAPVGRTAAVYTLQGISSVPKEADARPGEAGAAGKGCNASGGLTAPAGKDPINDTEVVVNGARSPELEAGAFLKPATLRIQTPVVAHAVPPCSLTVLVLSP